MPNVDLSRVPSFYHNYIRQVKQSDLAAAFQTHTIELTGLLRTIAPDKWDYRYAVGKWTIKEVVQHIIDAERIFCYRALRFARMDATPLPGFDENFYAENAEAGKRTSEELIAELETVQRSSVHLFNSFSENQLERSGVSNNNSIYVKAIGYIIVGHALHHKNILVERYLG